MEKHETHSCCKEHHACLDNECSKRKAVKLKHGKPQFALLY